jgi:hypothetical protein
MTALSARVPTISLVALLTLGAGIMVAPKSATAIASIGIRPAHQEDALVIGAAVLDGKPLANARVQAEVWPNTHVLATMPPGARVDVRRLPAVRTTAEGKFAVSLAHASLPAKYRDAKGHIQVMLRISDSQHEVQWNFTAKPADGPRDSGSSWTSALDTAPSAATVTSAVFELGAKASVSELGGTSATALASGKLTVRNAQSLGVRSAIIRQGLAVAACSPYFATNTWLYNRAEPFMHVYPGSKAAAVVTQSYGVDHTLGIGAKGAAGGWIGGSGGGRSTISLAASGSVRRTSNSTAFNSINFRDYMTTCGAVQRRPVSVYSILSRIDAATEPNFTACTIYSSGDFSKTQGLNKTFSNEVNIGPVSVDAQSGWNSESKVSWHITSRTGLCGNTNEGWVKSPEAEANSS